MQRVSKLGEHLKDGVIADVNKCPFITSNPSHGNNIATATTTNNHHHSTIKVEAFLPEVNEKIRANALEPSLILESTELSEDPINFLLKCKQQHPDLFMIRRKTGNEFLVISNAEMFEDILTFDGTFGNPQTPNMSVNKNIFLIPVDQLERHEQTAIGGLRQFILNNNDKMADKIAAKLIKYMDQTLGEKGVIDLRELGTAVFWPMTQTLFGDGASKENAPYLKQCFDDIDGLFGKALKGKPVPKVQSAVTKAFTTFSNMLTNAKQCPVGPIMTYYDQVTNSEDPNLTAKFSTAAWWGGQGNTLPSTVWSFGKILQDPRTKALAYKEVDEAFADQPNSNGEYDYSKLVYLTAALKETLRMYTYSIAWRMVQHDCVITSPSSGNSYKLKKGQVIGLHFCMRHMDPEVHPNPEQFQPERFLGTGAGLSPTINGKPYAWVPFSAGRHKCSGYSLAMLEIPVVMALVFRHYDMKLLDPLPGLDFKSAFGVIGPNENPVRVSYERRHN